MPRLTPEMVKSSLKQSEQGVRLMLKQKQVNSIEDLEYLCEPLQINYADFSFNMVRALADSLAEFRNLRFLDLSTNLLSRIEGLAALGNLQILRLSRNRITKIENLDALVSLNALDLSMNHILYIEGLERLESLQLLYLYGNQIKTLEGLQNLRNLKELRIEQNQITDISHLAAFQNELEVIEASENLISDLDTVVVTLSHLEYLVVLSLHGNPIASDPTYRFRILSFKQIEKLDGLIVQDYIRDTLDEVQGDFDLEVVVIKSQKAFNELIDKEKEVKNLAVELLRRQIKQVELDFDQYLRSLEGELYNLNEFVSVIRTKKTMGEDITRDKAKLSAWRQSLAEKETERMNSVRERQRRLEHEREQYMKDQRAAVDFTVRCT
jgi:Leucine-rich repeat (LRR) protein